MSALQSFRLKPNPLGKDRTRTGASATQLAGEWVDLKNVSTSNVDLTNVEVYHIAYKQNGATEWQLVTSFSKGILEPGQIVRIHSGGGPESAVSAADKADAKFHIFTDKNYIWNNDKADCCGLFIKGQSSHFDKACYDAYPPEGVTLQRVHDKFVVPAATPSYARR